MSAAISNSEHDPAVARLGSVSPLLHRTSAVRPTPYLDLDVGAAVTRYRRLAAALHRTTVHYAVKANPEPHLLHALAAAGCCFDVASPAEVTAALHAGAQPGELVYSNPIKRRADVAFAAGLGVALFVVDSVEETRKVASVAPGAKVLCRIGTSGEGSDWSLSRKYGCSPAEAVRIMRRPTLRAGARRWRPTAPRSRPRCGDTSLHDVRPRSSNPDAPSSPTRARWCPA